MKRIVICADGTWQSPESDHPTHVMRLARGIAPEDGAGNKQVVYYDWGVGSDGDRVRGGAICAGSRGLRRQVAGERGTEVRFGVRTPLHQKP